MKLCLIRSYTCESLQSFESSTLSVAVTDSGADPGFSKGGEGAKLIQWQMRHHSSRTFSMAHVRLFIYYLILPKQERVAPKG